MIKRTYSKRTFEISTRGDNGSIKRRRVEYADTTQRDLSSSSSPSRTPIFSDENALTSTPPSSPSSPQRSSPTSLQSTSKGLPSSSPPTKPSLTAITKTLLKPRPKPKQKLTQLTLDLGQKTQTRCLTCGMLYRPSHAQDTKLHKAFHTQNTSGIPLNPTLVGQIRAVQFGWDINTDEETILRLDTRVMGWAKVKKALRLVLGIVEAELGGVGIEEEKLSGTVDLPMADNTGEMEKRGASSDRYKTYLYVRGSKVVGVLLAERIFEAFTVLPPPDGVEARDTAITVSTDPQPAKMGISRIWVSKCARDQGVAVKMLDEACENFIHQISIPKHQVAFSQPTESGAKLARKWYGRKDGWGVYPG